jgi:hypothetical protein
MLRTTSSASATTKYLLSTGQNAFLRFLFVSSTLLKEPLLPLTKMSQTMA